VHELSSNREAEGSQGKYRAPVCQRRSEGVKPGVGAPLMSLSHQIMSSVAASAAELSHVVAAPAGLPRCRSPRSSAACGDGARLLRVR
jgi:hypothetical protein